MVRMTGGETVGALGVRFNRTANVEHFTSGDKVSSGPGGKLTPSLSLGDGGGIAHLPLLTRCPIVPSVINFINSLFFPHCHMSNSR